MRLLISSIAIITLIGSACKPESKTEPTPVPSQFIPVYFTTYWGNEVVVPGKIYYTSEGRPLSLQDFNMIFTHASFITQEGDTLTLERDRFLTKAGMNTLQLPIVQRRSFEKYYLRLGVDELTNTTVEPSMIQDSNDPLYPQVPFMWWTWATGYLFARVEGFTDLSENFDSEVPDRYSFHAGQTGLDRIIGPFEPVLENGKSLIKLKIDVKQFFDSLDLPNENSSHTFDNLKLVEKVMQLISSGIEEDK